MEFSGISGGNSVLSGGVVAGVAPAVVVVMVVVD